MKRTVILTLVAALTFAGCAGDNAGNDRDDNDTGGGGGGGGAREAVVVASTTSPKVNESVTFQARGASAGDTVRWEFGDGSNGTGASATHTYLWPGSYIVRLVVNDLNNERDLTYIGVSEPTTNYSDVTAGEARAPTAVIVLDRQVIQPGGNVSVNASGSAAYIANEEYDPELGITPSNLPFARDVGATENLTYSWDFGDGSAEVTTQGANHTYAQAGLYTIQLTVTDASGASAQSAASVVVLSAGAPVGGFKNKDLYVTATISGPQSFDPGFDYETAGGNVIEQVYETLFTTERGNTDRIIPELAAEVPTLGNGGITNNATTYTIKLKRGVTFHDGTPFNAAAVKFSLDRAILMNDPSSGAAVLAPILKGAREYRNDENNTNSKAERDEWLALNAVEVVDDHTVRIHLDAPNAAFFQRLAFYGTAIVSPTAVKACHPERVQLWGVCQTTDGFPPASDAASGRSITRDPWMDANAVGTGPFKLRTWLPGDRVILDRNDAWHEDPKPQLKTVIIQYVDDLNTRLLMLKSGDADEIYISPADLNRVKPGIEDIADFTQSDTLIIDAFFFNYDVQDNEQCPVANGQRDCQFFQDINVRKAFAHAFDYDTFFNDIWNGRAGPLAGVIPKGMPGYDPAQKAYTQDATLAKQYLSQSKGKDGFSVGCVFNTGNTVRQGACELIKQNLESLLPGKITVNVQPLPFDTVLDRTQSQQVAFWILGWSPDYIATDDYIEPFLHSDGNYPVNQNLEKANFSAELDEMIEEALHELDPVKQAEMYTEINQYAIDQYVDIFLDQRTSTHVARKYVQGFYYSPLHSGSPNTGDYTTIYKA